MKGKLMTMKHKLGNTAIRKEHCDLDLMSAKTLPFQICVNF